MQPQDFATTYITAKRYYFNDEDLSWVRSRLEHLPESAQAEIAALPLRHPMTCLFFACSFGYFAVDRFYLKQTVLAIVKLICILFVVGFIWVVIDVFLALGNCRRYNQRLLAQACQTNGRY